MKLISKPGEWPTYEVPSHCTDKDIIIFLELDTHLGQMTLVVDRQEHTFRTRWERHKFVEGMKLALKFADDVHAHALSAWYVWQRLGKPTLSGDVDADLLERYLEAQVHSIHFAIGADMGVVRRALRRIFVQRMGEEALPFFRNISEVLPATSSPMPDPEFVG